jgi:hypothetical protein
MNDNSIIVNGVEYVNKDLIQQGGNSLSTGDNYSGLVGKYVIVRRRDAGVHAGELIWNNGRECVLKDSRRLWYWKPLGKYSWLSGVAISGLDESSKIGVEVQLTHLTENCEIILCNDQAEKSIRKIQAHERS